MHEPDELLEGSQLFEELPGQVGLVLWQSLRDVTLWASVPDERRDGLFTREAANRRLIELLASGAEPALEVSLTTLAALVGAPAAASPDIISLVCLQVSQWAEARGAMATAMVYAQAAALTCPEEPGPALAAGSLALRWRRSARAETWLRRSIGLARRKHDWGPYSEAYVELGVLYARRGQPGPAHRYYVQGLRAARRHGMIQVRGSALHGMLLLAMESAALDDAERYGRAAMRAYGRGHARLPELVHDMAYLAVRREQYARAIPMLKKLLPTRVEPVERATTLSILSRAAAGVGDRPLYEESWMDAWTLINRRPGHEEKHSRALLELARASTAIGDWPHVEQAVRLATDSMSRHREPIIAAQVEELAAAIRARRVGDY
ncbi:MAG TPA: hypothetical protein VEX86_25215 [Longimicrobium sp.]|nr:hypothetical protein [Longimicrobium sp.]